MCRSMKVSLPHDELSAGDFDVITMWHSLEHVHEPLEVLRPRMTCSRPAGIVVAVPNIDSAAVPSVRPAWFGSRLAAAPDALHAADAAAHAGTGGFSVGRPCA